MTKLKLLFTSCFKNYRYFSKMSVDKRFVLESNTTFALLECRKAFDNLKLQEKFYAHHFARGSWYGGLIVLLQTSPESAGIYFLLRKFFEKLKTCKADVDAVFSKVLSEEEKQSFLVYCAGLMHNMANYKSFGDTKFVPLISKEKLEKLFTESGILEDTKSKTIWSSINETMFDLSESKVSLGLPPNGLTCYFSKNCTKEDADKIKDFLSAKDISAYNTRAFKLTEDGKTVYEIRMASAETSATGTLPGMPQNILGKHEYAGNTFLVTRGDYSGLMKLVVKELKLAKEYAANQFQKSMIDHYVESFETGSIPAHKEGSRAWIKDLSPSVESYIGFIESYRDPVGARGEFEGFTAVVDAEQSKIFATLAETLIERLPWGAAYEKDKFLRPDFTSLDIVAFGGSGPPAGINIPNYNEIRQDEGFKNVSLGNVLSASYGARKTQFIKESDKPLFEKWKLPSFEVQVGLHELLGHGSGKLFIKDKNGKFNFDIEKTKHLLTGDKITKWYEESETWESKFGSMSSTYEECRAECVGLYLCLWDDIMKIFGHIGAESEEVRFINWLCMALAGVKALEFYSPNIKKWGQAHMQARFVILRVLLEKPGLVKITEIKGEDGEPDLLVEIDRSKIGSDGKDAIEKFLCKLQAYKSTGDFENGKQMYEGYSALEGSGYDWLHLREIVLNRKQPRPMLVQCNTVISGDGKSVEVRDYEGSAYGLIHSFVDRFKYEMEDEGISSTDDILYDLWAKDFPKMH